MAVVSHRQAWAQVTPFVPYLLQIKHAFVKLTERTATGVCMMGQYLLLSGCKPCLEVCLGSPPSSVADMYVLVLPTRTVMLIASTSGNTAQHQVHGRRSMAGLQTPCGQRATGLLGSPLGKCIRYHLLALCLGLQHLFWAYCTKPFLALCA